MTAEQWEAEAISKSRTSRLTAVWVTFNSLAAAVKLPWRPAASNARNPFNDGKRRIALTPI